MCNKCMCYYYIIDFIIEICVNVYLEDCNSFFKVYIFLYLNFGGIFNFLFFKCKKCYCVNF